MSDIDYGGGYACGREGSMWEISVPSSQFCCKPKTALKNSVLKKSNHTHNWGGGVGDCAHAQDCPLRHDQRKDLLATTPWMNTGQNDKLTEL